MTSEDLRSELERQPFSPLRLHLVSGKTIEVTTSSDAWLLQNAVMVFQQPRTQGDQAGRYDVISLRNIERIEQLPPD